MRHQTVRGHQQGLPLAGGTSAIDRFTYAATDGLASVDSALGITVTGANDAPVTTDDAAIVVEDWLTSATGNVLANDADGISFRRIINKPNGYAGDAQMMTFIYRNQFEGKTPFGMFLHKHAVSTKACQAVRNRKLLMPSFSIHVEAINEVLEAAVHGDRNAALLVDHRLHGAQRVALARALVLEPRILLLDEPLSYLDPLIKRRLVADFSEILSADGVTALYVTHDQDEAMVVADRVSIIHEGKVVRSGGVDEVMSLPTTAWIADFIGMDAALRGTITGAEDGIAEILVADQYVHAVTPLPVGIDVLVGIRPEDVMLFEAGAELPVSSARNRFEMRVDAIEHRGSTERASLSAGGLRIAATVSRSAARDLDLQQGSAVVALFKATSVRVESAVEVPSGV